MLFCFAHSRFSAQASCQLQMQLTHADDDSSFKLMMILDSRIHCLDWKKTCVTVRLCIFFCNTILKHRKSNINKQKDDDERTLRVSAIISPTLVISSIQIGFMYTWARKCLLKMERSILMKKRSVWHQKVSLNKINIHEEIAKSLSYRSSLEGRSQLECPRRDISKLRNGLEAASSSSLPSI